jgi:hypothetical protein
VIEAHARGGAGATVTTGDHELAVAKLLHHLDLVERHGAEGIVDVVLTTFLRADIVAIAAQVGANDMEVLGEPACDAMPRHVGQRIAMQQQERRPVAAMAQVNARATGFDLRAVESFEHQPSPQGLRAIVIPRRSASGQLVGHAEHRMMSVSSSNHLAPSRSAARR